MKFCKPPSAKTGLLGQHYVSCEVVNEAGHKLDDLYFHRDYVWRKTTIAADGFYGLYGTPQAATEAFRFAHLPHPLWKG